MTPDYTARELRLYGAMNDLDSAIGLVSAAQRNLFMLDRDSARVEPLIKVKAALVLASDRAAAELSSLHMVGMC
jgi:hypothetical protein